tara:strand:+ start:94 stop:567 length:474 start_codon:yes stop_codon:yes gene_type:complete
MSLGTLKKKTKTLNIPMALIGTTSLNGKYSDGTAIRTVLNTPGYIDSHFKHPTSYYIPECGKNGNSFKEICKTFPDKSNEQYILNKSMKCDISGGKTKICNNTCKSYFIGGQKFYIQNSINKIVTLTNHEYIIQKQKRNAVCVSNTIVPPNCSTSIF